MRGRCTAATLLAGGLVLTGCSTALDLDVRDGGYADGTFTGRSQADDDGGYGEISLTIRNDDITAATFTLHLEDGSVKDAEYGKTNGKVVDSSTYRRAQAGIAAAPSYAADLVETDDPADVDAVTGASLSYSQFQEAVEDALRQARR
ncbi:FMN-binding protein [Propionicimonas sp.]|uniref:FMN-binding protein n=1 Tax=Propionicimonas sp. TaxID=1955623 RepID=UPI0039E621EA